MKDDLYFNLDHGYAEGLCRGFKSGILRSTDYHNLVQCETLEGTAKEKVERREFLSLSFVERSSTTFTIDGLWKFSRE